MYKFIKDNAWAFYLGGAIGGITGLSVLTWEFYAILIPTVLLVTWKAYDDSEA